MMIPSIIVKLYLSKEFNLNALVFQLVTWAFEGYVDL